jgi:hypothetical protein
MNDLSGGRDHGTIPGSIFHGFPEALERLQCDGTIARGVSPLVTVFYGFRIYRERNSLTRHFYGSVRFFIWLILCSKASQKI